MKKDFPKRTPPGLGFSRRAALSLMGAAVAGPLLGGGRGLAASGGPTGSGTAATPACVVRPQQGEGPYFADEHLNRSDLRSDPSDGSVRPGVPLRLTFRVSRMEGNACAPLSNAVVDVWHCDALGVYSDVQDRQYDTRGKKFLRGYQTTDAGGVARFITIYPGWYPGRTVHLHFKIRTDPATKPSLEFTSQLYFDDALTDQVHAQAPYASKGPRTVRNDGDGLFRRGGQELILKLSPDAQGYAATFDIALQMGG